jgi:hypothetical protein
MWNLWYIHRLYSSRKTEIKSTSVFIILMVSRDKYLLLKLFEYIVKNPEVSLALLKNHQHTTTPSNALTIIL